MRTYPSDRHHPVRTAEDLADGIANQRAVDCDGAVDLEAYFASARIQDFTTQEMMRAAVPKGVTRMHPDAWVSLFNRNGF